MNGTRLVVAVLGGAATVALTLIVISLATGGGDDSATTTVASTATSTTPEPPVQIETASLAAIRGLPQQGFVLGPASAKPLIVEYADLQCPFCADYSTGNQHEVIDRYVKPGTARLEFRGLSFIGEDSTRALRFVHAAAAKNKAWDVIELLYENQGEENSGWVTDGLVRAIATEVGLDPAAMVDSLTSTAYDAAIARTNARARADDVSATPSHYVVVDGRSAFIGKGDVGADEFAAAIETATSG
jgi:protein-disulfide isomerase